MRPTVQLTSLDRSSDPSGPRFDLKPPLRVETPLRCAESHGTGSGLGAVSRLEALIETRSHAPSHETKSEIVIVKCPPKELKSKIEIDLKPDAKEQSERRDKNQVTSVIRSKTSERENYADLKQNSILFSTKSVPNLVELVDKTHVTQLRNIDSTNLSVSLPFDLNEISESVVPQPCQVTEYDDFFTLDQTVLERSERRSVSKSNALRYRSSIRIMVRPEASAALLADPESSVEFSTNKTPPGVPHRSIVKEQFR